ncbi:hypothetical protein [Micromonospora sp. WMMD1082]|uniref:hypothetical protein n=1 Tax=Micromonospora sp. WMMD1082 TaxID=3016104 RepID=UPI0024165CE5|nr:hypothetical protein [Micromonospora sp. WMMD1082]MDG4797317.1 hypothetical protein [Micromonospora sp. WMMD1082]
MKRIVEIVPARPGWYARWRLDPESTRCYAVSLWALVEEADGTGREVIGVDCAGQWPGDDGTVAEFVRYLFKTPDSGPPEDAESTPRPDHPKPIPVT